MGRIASSRSAFCSASWTVELPLAGLGLSFRAKTSTGRPVGVVARPESPSPASGSSTVHDAEQSALLDAALRVET